MPAQSIGVIGAGGWGTALTKLLADKGAEVTLWCHGATSYHDLVDRRENRAYLPGINLPANVEVTQSLEVAGSDKRLIICAVPSHAVRDVFSKLAPVVALETILVCGTKGLEEETFNTMGELLGDIFGADRKQRQGFLSGPTFAIEVARQLPAAVTVAAYDDNVAKEIQASLSTPSFRVYTSPDVVGVQIGGVVKNVIAIAAGISDGLGLGHNARAALITRGLAEMTRLAVCLGADAMTLAGLPGLGDLVLTSTDDLSRNRTVGLQIARGETLLAITAAKRTVAEGVRNTRSLHALARRRGIDMPIVEQMYQVLYGGKKPADAVADLMQRSLKSELA